MRVPVRAAWGVRAASGGLALVLLAALAACGDRSALLVAEPADAAATDASPDARPDAAGPDARPEAEPDVRPDVATDAPPDAPVFDCPDAGDGPISVLGHASGG